MSQGTRKQGNAVILDLEGKLGLGPAVDDFRSGWSGALATGSRNVVVNLTNVPVIDSSGIGCLVRCHAAVAAKGGKLKIVGASEVVRQALKLTNVDQFFEFHENEASALAALGGGATPAGA
jgi:anti-sigma B factor antagonist